MMDWAAQHKNVMECSYQPVELSAPTTPPNTTHLYGKGPKIDIGRRSRVFRGSANNLPNCGRSGKRSTASPEARCLETWMGTAPHDMMRRNHTANAPVHFGHLWSHLDVGLRSTRDTIMELGRHLVAPSAPVCHSTVSLTKAVATPPTHLLAACADS